MRSPRKRSTLPEALQFSTFTTYPARGQGTFERSISVIDVNCEPAAGTSEACWATLGSNHVAALAAGLDLVALAFQMATAFSGHDQSLEHEGRGDLPLISMTL